MTKPKHPGGRPPVASTARACNVNVRFTSDEKAAASELAAAEGLSLSDWIRALVRSAQARRARRAAPE